MIGSIFQRFGSIGIYSFAGIVIVLLSVFALLSSSLSWWGAIFGWLTQQTAAEVAMWLLLPTAFCALVSYALLRNATV
jgi:hypothetical protein